MDDGPETRRARLRRRLVGSRRGVADVDSVVLAATGLTTSVGLSVLASAGIEGAVLSGGLTWLVTLLGRRAELYVDELGDAVRQVELAPLTDTQAACDHLVNSLRRAAQAESDRLARVLARVSTDALTEGSAESFDWAEIVSRAVAALHEVHVRVLVVLATPHLDPIAVRLPGIDPHYPRMLIGGVTVDQLQQVLDDVAPGVDAMVTQLAAAGLIRDVSGSGETYDGGQSMWSVTDLGTRVLNYINLVDPRDD